ncbi:hypothetical protein RJI07_02620 [Mycoplasmatota bacterium WC30]
MNNYIQDNWFLHNALHANRKFNKQVNGYNRALLYFKRNNVVYDESVIRVPNKLSIYLFWNKCKSIFSKIGFTRKLKNRNNFLKNTRSTNSIQSR